VDLLNGDYMLLEVKAVRSLDEGVRYRRGRVGSSYKKDISKSNYKVILITLMFLAMVFVIQNVDLSIFFVRRVLPPISAHKKTVRPR
jgi:hypothetical protein